MTTVTLPESMIKQFERIAGKRKSPAAFIKQVVKERMDYEEWKLAQVDAGLKEIEAGKGIPDAEFRKLMGVPQRGRKAA
jgi:predicted transcriptional regulator